VLINKGNSSTNNVHNFNESGRYTTVNANFQSSAKLVCSKPSGTAWPKAPSEERRKWFRNNPGGSTDSESLY
jgi:hypothetical protein